MNTSATAHQNTPRLHLCLYNLRTIMNTTNISHRPRRAVAPHLDFSPMTALGLLLCAFFMVNANLQKPSVMPLSLPDYHGEEEACVCNPPVLTLLCTAQKIYFYEGLTKPRLDSVDYSPSGLRSLILRKMSSTEASIGLEEFVEQPTGQVKKASRLEISIKLTPCARYGNLVDVIDEMRICRVRRYNLMSITETDRRIIQEVGRHSGRARTK